MPELPELEALRRDLTERAGGQRVTRCELASVSALKTYDPPLESLIGGRLCHISRRGKYLCFEIRSGESTAWLVTHLARGGWVRWYEQLPSGSARPSRGPLALRLGLESGAGMDITEMGTQKRLALWIVARLDDLQQIATLGPDPISPPLDLPLLETVLDDRTATLKSVLTDQRLVAGIGNAYSDEILHAARLSPFRPAGRLDPMERKALLQAIAEVLEDAVNRSRGQQAADLKQEKKEGLKIHGRTGQPCAVCGDTIREVSFADRSLQYCPTCQTGGKVLADRRFSRLLR